MGDERRGDPFHEALVSTFALKASAKMALTEALSELLGYAPSEKNAVLGAYRQGEVSGELPQQALEEGERFRGQAILALVRCRKNLGRGKGFDGVPL